MCDHEFAVKHWIMVTTLDDNGWDDGDSSSWSMEAGSESAAREFYSMLIASAHDRLLRVMLVGPDGVSYLEDWHAPKCERCGALNRRAAATSTGALLCSECRAGNPDFAPDSVTPEVVEPAPEPYWSNQDYVPAGGEGSRCKMCGAPRGDHEGIYRRCCSETLKTYQALGGYARQRWSDGFRYTPALREIPGAEDQFVQACIYCGEVRGNHSASGLRCELVKIEDYVGLETARKLSRAIEVPAIAEHLAERRAADPSMPLHDELVRVAQAAKPECRRVGRGRYEVHDVVSGHTYTFHDKVTRLSRHRDVVLGNRRQGSGSVVVMLEAGARVDLGVAEHRPARSQPWHLTGKDAKGRPARYSGQTFEMVAIQAADGYWSKGV